jgi:hypothetical protein|tara:strand:- start:2388 stop:2717 length:330 start_codon:yes stop_codon:yes gene_type:complete
MTDSIITIDTSKTPIKVSRPMVDIKSSPSGKKFTFMISSPNWAIEYLNLETFPCYEDAIVASEIFTNNFDKEATEIEKGTIRPYMIMPTLVEHGLFKKRDKLSSNFIAK